MQKTVELSEAKRQLSKLVDDAAAGYDFDDDLPPDVLGGFFGQVNDR